MNPLELTLDSFFNQYRATPGHFDSLEEGDIFIALEVVEVFFRTHRFTTTQISEFLQNMANIPRIQGIMTFKMPQQRLMHELDSFYARFQAKKAAVPQRVHRKESIVGKQTEKKTQKAPQHKVVK